MSAGLTSNKLKAETMAKMMICQVSDAPHPAMMAEAAAPIAKHRMKKSPDDNSRMRHTMEMITQMSQRLDVKYCIIICHYYISVR
jgi:hypothetical protein